MDSLGQLFRGHEVELELDRKESYSEKGLHILFTNSHIEEDPCTVTVRLRRQGLREGTGIDIDTPRIKVVLIPQRPNARTWR